MGVAVTVTDTVAVRIPGQDYGCLHHRSNTGQGYGCLQVRITGRGRVVSRFFCAWGACQWPYPTDPKDRVHEAQAQPHAKLMKDVAHLQGISIGV